MQELRQMMLDTLHFNNGLKINKNLAFNSQIFLILLMETLKSLSLLPSIDTSFFNQDYTQQQQPFHFKMNNFLLQNSNPYSHNYICNFVNIKLNNQFQSGHSELLGKNVQDKGRVQNILGVLKDTLKEIKQLFRNKQYSLLKAQALEKVKSKLDLLQKYIGQKKWTLGYLTLADFQIAENSYYFATLYPEQYSNWSFWQTIRENFNSLPQIEAYYASENAFIQPFNPKEAALIPKFRPTITLGYWAIRGLGQISRLLLSYTGVNFVDKAYTQRQDYLLKDKFELGLDFPNLPYLTEGQFKITQSSAIQKYVINRSNKKQLLGKNLQDYIKIEQIIGVFSDVFTEVAKLIFSKDPENQKKQILSKITPKLEHLGKFIGQKDTSFEYLTLADFLIAQYSNYIEAAFPEQYKNWHFLTRVRAHINNLPSTKAYYARKGSIKGPFLPPPAGLQPSWEQYK